ncbi:MAG: DUF72 domain-containing protein [Deltaproteobacteria bacterium]|nr:MAG: DUF72 domain-containing protein [Deltaproteobacteria bacterium]
MSAVKIGCCGFPVGRQNYYRHFFCVEIQQTFYHPPGLETLTRWLREAPEGFEFTMKAWQLITHSPQSPTYRRLRMEIPDGKLDQYGNFRRTEEVLLAWQTTRRAAEALGARIIIFQTPRSFRGTIENKANLTDFFQNMDRDQLIFGWEPRGWEEGEVEDLCRKLDVLHVVDPFQGKNLWGEITYCRLHGIGGYRYRYSDEDLAQLQRWVPRKGIAYVMFNNTSMFQDGLRFKEMWGSKEDVGS